jgi:RHS repeat-associated protein
MFGIIIEATIARGWLQRVENPDYTYRQTLEYYENGNVKQQVVLKYFTYDYRNMPVQVTYEWENIDTYRYYYDENGMRVRREKVGASSGREYYLRDHTGREVAIYDYNSNRIKMINLFGHGLEGKVNVDWQYVCIPSGCSPDGCEWTWLRTDSKYYYVKDHLGNIRVTLQQNGNLASARDYYPYGETLRAYTTAGVGDRYQFTEKERDAETNLDYFGARYYDGGIIRWLTPDPLTDKYYGWSPYNYTLGNPLRYVDPDGMRVVMNEDSTQQVIQEMNNERKDQDVTNENNLEVLPIYMSNVSLGTNNEKLALRLGQVVIFDVKNINTLPLGTTVRIISEFPYKSSQEAIILPGLPRTFVFNNFGSEPMNWRFTISTISDVKFIEYTIRSSWVPGMPHNPSIPRSLPPILY